MKNEKMENCDCLKKMSELIKAKVTEDKKGVKGYKMIEADWGHKSWYPAERLYSAFVITNTFEKKDGTTSKPNKKSISIFYTYCPFCGKKNQEMEKIIK